MLFSPGASVRKRSGRFNNAVNFCKGVAITVFDRIPDQLLLGWGCAIERVN